MNNAQKLKELADTVVLASEDLAKNRVQIAHALLQKGLDAVGKIEGLNASSAVEEVFRRKFECDMIERGYSADDFSGFDAEGEFTYYSAISNCMFDAWCAALAAT